MQLARYFDFAARTHTLLAPLILLFILGSGYAALVAGTDGGLLRTELTFARLVGTLATFVGLPAYLLATIPPGQRLAEHVLDQLAPFARASDVEAVRVATHQIRGWPWAVAFGVTFGLSLNAVLIEVMIRARTLHPLDVGFLLGACITWTAAGLLLCWRLAISAAFSKLGEHASLDLYRIDQLRPLSRVANTDVLIVVGAMAFSPLQSLDAQFRFGNYFPAIIIGIPAALILFVRPLWGLRAQIMQAKRERLGELYELVDSTDRADISRLESVAAHVDRVRAIPNWPIDTDLIARLFGYVIIPPLAWVAAAMVENFIDRLTR